VVSFTPRPLYPQGKSPRYPFDRLGGPQSRANKILVTKPEGKVAFGGPTRTWEDNNIEINLTEQQVNVCSGSMWFRLGPSGTPAVNR